MSQGKAAGSFQLYLKPAEHTQAWLFRASQPTQHSFSSLVVEILQITPYLPTRFQKTGFPELFSERQICIISHHFLLLFFFPLSPLCCMQEGVARTSLRLSQNSHLRAEARCWARHPRDPSAETEEQVKPRAGEMKLFCSLLPTILDHANANVTAATEPPTLPQARTYVPTRLQRVAQHMIVLGLIQMLLKSVG